MTLLLKSCKLYYDEYKSARIQWKDCNGETPLDLSIERKRLKVEWALRTALLSPRSVGKLSGSLSRLMGIGKQRLWTHLGTFLTFQFIGFTDYERSLWACRLVFTSYCIGLYYSFKLAFHPLLQDLNVLHSISLLLQIFLLMPSFLACYSVHPGAVIEPLSSSTSSFSNDGEYSKCLELIGGVQASDSEGEPDPSSPSSSSSHVSNLNLCHTCHVRKPLRSKHCKILNRCIHKFDHYCPFVGTLLNLVI